MFALDGKTGAILWRYAAGSSVNSGPAVVDGTVYWGSGYDRGGEGNGNNKLFAFSLPGRHGKHAEPVAIRSTAGTFESPVTCPRHGGSTAPAAKDAGP